MTCTTGPKVDRRHETAKLPALSHRCDRAWRFALEATRGLLFKLSRTGFPSHFQSFRGLWMGIDPSRPRPRRRRLHEPIEERHLGRAGAHTPDHELEQILAISIGRQLFLTIVGAILILDVLLAHHLASGHPD